MLTKNAKCATFETDFQEQSAAEFLAQGKIKEPRERRGSNQEISKILITLSLKCIGIYEKSVLPHPNDCENLPLGFSGARMHHTFLD